MGHEAQMGGVIQSLETPKLLHTYLLLVFKVAESLQCTLSVFVSRCFSITNTNKFCGLNHYGFKVAI